MRVAKRILLTVLVCFFATRGKGAQELPSAEPAQTIRVDVQRVNVGVIVTDARGQFIRELKREDFHAFDNNI